MQRRSVLYASSPSLHLEDMDEAAFSSKLCLCWPGYLSASSQDVQQRDFTMLLGLRASCCSKMQRSASYVQSWA